MKLKIVLSVGTLGIIEGDNKRALENYIHPMFFDQRKQYDEYTINAENITIKVDIKDLMLLSEYFKIQINENNVDLFEK